MKIPMVSSATSSQRSPMPRLPRSNVYSTRDPANPSASVHRKRFFTPSLTLKFLCAGYLNPRLNKMLRDQILQFPIEPFVCAVRLSNAMPLRASWRLAYSWPLRHSLALNGK